MSQIATRNVFIAFLIAIFWPAFMLAPHIFSRPDSDIAFITGPIIVLPFLIARLAASYTRGTFRERVIPTGLAPLVGVPITIAIFGQGVEGNDLHRIYFFAAGPALLYWLWLAVCMSGSPTFEPQPKNDDS